MEKRVEGKGQGSCLHAALHGLMGATVFFGLLLLAAGLGDRHGAIMDGRIPLTKGCLLLSAFLCALTAGKKAEQGKLVHALCAEAVLGFVLAICAMAQGTEVHLLSIAVDLFLLLFGAFAGTLLHGKRRVKRRGKR